MQKWKLILWFSPGRQVCPHRHPLTSHQWDGKENQNGRSEKTCLWYLPLPTLVAAEQTSPSGAPSCFVWQWWNLPVSGCQSRWLWFYPRKHLNPTHSVSSSPVSWEQELVGWKWKLMVCDKEFNKLKEKQAETKKTKWQKATTSAQWVPEKWQHSQASFLASTAERGPTHSGISLPAVPTMSPPLPLCAPSLALWGCSGRHWHPACCASAAQQWLKHLWADHKPKTAAPVVKSSAKTTASLVRFATPLVEIQVCVKEENEVCAVIWGCVLS